jgi:hypothetical protein
MEEVTKFLHYFGLGTVHLKFSAAQVDTCDISSVVWACFSVNSLPVIAFITSKKYQILPSV